MLVLAVVFVVVDFLARRLVRCSPLVVEDDLRVVDLLAVAVLVDDDLPLLVDRFLRFDEPKSSTIIAAEAESSVVELSLCCCFLPRFMF